MEIHWCCHSLSNCIQLWDHHSFKSARASFPMSASDGIGRDAQRSTGRTVGQGLDMEGLILFWSRIRKLNCQKTNLK